MPGEVRCPTCGRQTPIAPFCIHCGGALPEVATRPRGLDRRDLEERIRLRRGGESPFHRGSGDWDPAAAGGGPAAFVPEPADELARREGDAAAPAAGHVDNLADQPSGGAWGPAPAEPPAPPPARAPAAAPSRPVPATPVPATVARAEAQHQAPAARGYDEPARYDEPVRYDEPGRYDPAGGYDGPGYDGPGYDESRGSGPPAGYEPDGGYGGYEPPAYDAYEPGYDDGPPRRSGSIAVLGFVVLGIAALLGGAILFSLMNSGPGTASATGTPTATAAATQQPSTSETPAPSSGGSASPSASGGESASPSSAASSGVPADFSASTQPCATSDMGFKGCAEDGSTISGDQVWIWVGFKNGRSSDVLGVAVVDASGTSQGDGSLELSQVGCDPTKPCSGYVTMRFGQLAAGTYDIKITLNDTDVASGSFTVS